VLRVAGQPLPPQGDAIANALDLVRRYATSEIALKLPDGSAKKLRRNVLGAEIDRARLAKYIEEARDASSPLRRAHDLKAPGAPLDIPIPLTLDADIAIGKLLDLKAELDTAATDAYVDLEAKQLKPEKIGHRLDVYGTLARIDEALQRGADSIDAVVEKIEPKLLASQARQREVRSGPRLLRDPLLARSEIARSDLQFTARGVAARRRGGAPRPDLRLQRRPSVRATKRTDIASRR